MQIFYILFIIAYIFPIINSIRYRSMNLLPHTPYGRCSVIDPVSNFIYVKPCIRGRCNLGNKINFEGTPINSAIKGGFYKVTNSIYGECEKFKLTGLHKSPCLDNSECWSGYCDSNVGCEENYFCLNHFSCETGKFCNSSRMCDIMRFENNPCNSNEECDIYMLCDNNICVPIGNVTSNDSIHTNPLVCRSGMLNNDGYCIVNITGDETCLISDELDSDGKFKYYATMNINGVSTNVSCEHISVIDEKHMPDLSPTIKKAFEEYYNIMSENKVNGRDTHINWNNNRIHGDKSNVKKAYIKYLYPEFYINEEDDNIDDICEFFMQLVLYQKHLKIHFGIIIFLFFLII